MTPEKAAEAWAAIGKQEAVLEAFIDFEREISVVAARGEDGQFVHYGAIENQHSRHILDVSVAPARVLVASRSRGGGFIALRSREAGRGGRVVRRVFRDARRGASDQ